MIDFGLHTEIFSPLSVVLLLLGAVLCYGAKPILGIFYKKPDEKWVLIIKLIGMLMAIAGVIIIFK